MEGKGKKLIWVLFSLSAVLAIISIFLVITSPIGVKEYDVSFNVSYDAIGFDLNTTALTFGKILPQGSSTRNIIFENDYEKAISIQILASKEIINYLDFQSEYGLLPGENVTIPITVNIPLDAPEKEFRGKIRVVLKD